MSGTRLRRRDRHAAERAPRLGHGAAAGRGRALPAGDRADATVHHDRVSSILALDQGTTGSAALVFDADAHVRGSSDREIAQHYPSSGHVEHDAEEIFASTVAVGRDAISKARIQPADIAALGI